MPPHCDSMDGPVVAGAIRALERGDVEEALRFVPAWAEEEVRAAYASALRARGAAQDVADRYFAETVVRLHRAGEGEPFTGLKPAGLDHGPVVPVAEEAIDTGSAEELLRLLSGELRHQVTRRFDEVMELRAGEGEGLPAKRSATSATLGLQVWAHKLYGAMRAAAHSEEADQELIHTG